MIHSVNEAKNAAKELNDFLSRINSENDLGKSNGFYVLTPEQINLIVPLVKREADKYSKESLRLYKLYGHSERGAQLTKKWQSLIDVMNCIRKQELKMQGI